MFSVKALKQKNFDLSEKNLGLRDAKKGSDNAGDEEKNSDSDSSSISAPESIGSEGSRLTVDFLSFSNPGWSYKR